MPNSKPHQPLPTVPPFHSGLGVVTILGMCLVASEHYLTLIDRPFSLQGKSLLGSVGVYCFLLLSGYHAAGSQRPPIDWLRRRLSRIYPAFWIVTGISFLAAWATGVQSFDATQVIAQLSGFGFFTHPNSLILEPLWFISPLIVCYLVVFCIRVFGGGSWLSLAGLLLLIWLVSRYGDRWAYFSFLAFAIGYAIATSVPLRQNWWVYLVVGVLITLATPLDSHAFRLGCACLLFAGGLMITCKLPGVQWVSERSYEFYLVHGLAFYGALRYLKLDPIIGGIVALVGSVVLAELLYRFVKSLRRVTRELGIYSASRNFQPSQPPAISGYNPLDCAE